MSKVLNIQARRIPYVHTKHPPYTSLSLSKRAPDHKGPGLAAGLVGQGQGHQNHFCLGYQDSDLFDYVFDF